MAINGRHRDMYGAWRRRARPVANIPKTLAEANICWLEYAEIYANLSARFINDSRQYIPRARNAAQERNI